MILDNDRVDAIKHEVKTIYKGLWDYVTEDIFKGIHPNADEMGSDPNASK